MPILDDVYVGKQCWNIDPLMPGTFEPGPSLPFDATNIEYDENGQRWLCPGMLVAINADHVTNATYYIPYSSTASYGTYSDVPFGVLRHPVNATWENISFDALVVRRGNVVKRYCFELGKERGDISVSTMNQMPLITFV